MLPPLFGKWIKQIGGNPQMDKDLNIDTDALFFSFNYTLVLERTYHIDEKKVWHIHNSIENPDNIIIGHDSDEGKLYSTYLSNKTNYIVSPDFVDRINRKTAQGSKKVKKIIENQGDRFRSLYSQIKHIVVMGFSFNDIDMPYIEKIWSVNEHKKDTIWTLYVYTPEDESIIGKLIAMGVNKIQTKNW